MTETNETNDPTASAGMQTYHLANGDRSRPAAPPPLRRLFPPSLEPGVPTGILRAASLSPQEPGGCLGFLERLQQRKATL